MFKVGDITHINSDGKGNQYYIFMIDNYKYILMSERSATMLNVLNFHLITNIFRENLDV